MTYTRLATVTLAILIGSSAVLAQGQDEPRVKEPPRTEKVDVQIRYRIRADRDERVRQFRGLEKHLTALGFEDSRKDDPDRDLDILDPNAERFTGTAASDKVLQLLDDPRVEQILFAPTGYMYPEDRTKPVPVRIILRADMIPSVQQAFHFQTLQQLERMGFREALGYDTRGYKQLKGTIPYKYLDRLVKDLRTEPAGWFLTETPLDRLPRPFADRNPLRWVEVMPPAEALPAYVPEVVPPTRAKMPPDLRAILADPAQKEIPLRVIVLFAEPIDSKLEELRSKLTSGFSPTVKRDADGNPLKGSDGLPALTEGAALDGAAGNLASIRFDRPADVERFAQQADVLSVRLPRQASETISPIPAPGKPASAGSVLTASGVEAMHRLGYTGDGVKVLVIGSDFSGAEKLIGKGLPKKTRILDLTTELNPDILPSPVDPNRAGLGTSAALALAVAAPDAELVLVRVDPGAIFQLFGIVRVVRKEATFSDALRSRLVDISNKTAELTRRKEIVVTEYRLAFDDLADDEPTKARRVRAKIALDAVLADQVALTQRIERFNVFQKSVLSALVGTRVIVNTLEWESGYPLDALSQLSRTLEQLAVPLPPRIVKNAGDLLAAPPPPLVWVQAASAAGAAVWGGPFLDPNTDGAMEFASPNQPLPPMNWSADMNFLGFQSATGETTGDLPAGARLRITIQWREPTDPNFPSVDRPAYPVVLRLFRQLDPKGEKIPSDEMAEDARSAGGPYPLLFTRTYVVFEQVLEFTVKEPGRYALAVAKGYEPEALLPGLKRKVEVHPRIVIETLSGKPGEGRAVFRSYVTPEAGVGIPGDSLGANTIGVPVKGDVFGGGTGLALRGKPDLFGPDSLDIAGPAMRGPGLATGYLGGMATGLVQAGAAGANPFKSAGFTHGTMAVVPENWLKILRPVAKPDK
ncbi:MAG: hypothetical protein C0467_05360 [Planctomycetaceae bacterium]|nr:hypothetical protein [Planctomycetaceae bacterium]